jgi:1A family penicillin-binding protein
MQENACRVYVGVFDGSTATQKPKKFGVHFITQIFNRFKKNTISSVELKKKIDTSHTLIKTFDTSKQPIKSISVLRSVAIQVPKALIHLPSLPHFAVSFTQGKKQSIPKERIKNTKNIHDVQIISSRKNMSFVIAKTFIAGIIVAFLFFFLPWNAYQWLVALPNPKLLSRRDLEVTTKIYDRNGVLLYEIYADENRKPVPLSEIPKYLKEAVVSIEDKEFYHHGGVSLRGIARAAWMIYNKKQIQGGSTLTQQLIKTALLSPETKLSRKIQEAALAIWAEQLYSKDQILEMYLNQVPFGGTAWGVEAASQQYFGKSVKDITLAEAALLAGLPAAPSDYSPFGNSPEKAYERQKEVLRRMVEDGYVTEKEAENAQNEHIAFAPPATTIRAPHFVMYVKDLLESRFGAKLVNSGGLEVRTSLDINLQEKTEEITSNVVAGLARLNVGNGAVIITNPKTGEILAMVGSRNYWDIDHDGNVNIALTQQSPGSTVKAVTYATALESGYTAATLINDSPVVYKLGPSETYAPVNYDLKFHGLVPVRLALANSYNIPAIRVIDSIGIDEIVKKGRQMGIDSWKDDRTYGLSLTLGGADVTMLDMARVFGTLANYGKKVDLMPILEVTDFRGRTLLKNSPNAGIQAVREEAAWIIGNILSDNYARSSAFGPNSELVISGKTVSVKTGTSNDKRDNWAIGYTPSYVITTWVGNNDNTPMNPLLSSGLTGASTIWHQVMTEILKDLPDEPFERPEGVVELPCYNGRNEYFIRGTEPPGGRCQPLPTPTPTGEPTPGA